MNELIQRISSYDLFNNLLPGALFVYVGERWTHYQFGERNDLLSALLTFYVIGLVINRLGSIGVEWFTGRTGLVKSAAYERYVRASREDPMVQILAEVRSLYRSLFTLMLALGALKVYEWLSESCAWWARTGPYVSCFLLLGLLFLSWQKQAEYVFKRVEVETSSPESNASYSQSEEPE